MNKKTKFLFVGRTASGKSSIVRAVCEKLNLVQVKSFTTRPARPGETDDNSDHYFVDQLMFDLIMAEHNGDKVVAYTKINEYEYCTTQNTLDKSNVYVIDPDGIDYLKKVCGDKYNFIEIYIRVPYRIAEQRFVERGGTKADFKQRYDKESEQFGNYEKEQKFDYHLLNDKDFDSAVDTVCKWIKKEMENENE